ncbi:MAG: hypothetical protein ACKOC9_02965, partial [Alphaproteobacteria bacterium]
MASNDEEANIIDRPPNFLREAPFYCAVSASKSGDIKHRNLKQHGATWLVGDNGDAARLPNVVQITLQKGQTLRGRDSSGGGYGDPLTR